MKRRLALLLLACLLPVAAGAQILPSAHPEADAEAFARVRARMDSIRQYRPTVALVLGGGGARGLAHLGVIRYMEELGIPVDIVTGTSMGGLVGGLYALGYNAAQLDSLVRAIEWPVMMSDQIPSGYISYRLRKYRERFLIRIPFHYDDEDLEDPSRQDQFLERMADEADPGTADMLSESIARAGIGMPDGYLYGLNVRNMLSSVSVGYQDSLSFAQLPIPFACVATDLHALAPKYWTSGHLTDALRSTMAIPFYFRAVRQNGEILLDGGMRNNLPVDIAREMGADIIIGSEMTIRRGLNELNSPVDFLMQTITLLSASALDPALEMLDARVHHELKGYNMLSFDSRSVDDIIRQGYQNALQNKEQFETIAHLVAGKGPASEAVVPPAVNLAQRKVRVGEVRFTGLTEDEQHTLFRKVSLPEDGLYDKELVEQVLNNIFGTNAFESVTYHMEGRQEPYTLVFDCQKGQVNDFAVSLRADTDETVAVCAHLGLGTRRLAGPRMTADLKLGTNPSLAVSGMYQFRGVLPAVGITARTRLVNTSYGYMSDTHNSLLKAGADLFVEDSQVRRGLMRAGLTAEMTPYEHYLSIDLMRQGWNWKSYWLSAFADLKLDTFDDGYFPTRGLRLQLDGRYVFKGYSYDVFAEKEVAPYLSVLTGAEGAFSIGEHFTILPSTYLGWMSRRRGEMNPTHVVAVGGFLYGRYVERQIPFFAVPAGYRHCNPCVAVAQLDLRYRFARKNFVTLRGGLEADNDNWGDLIQQDPMLAAGLEYARQTIVGPLRFAVQWNNIYGLSAYASIGFAF